MKLLKSNRNIFFTAIVAMVVALSSCRITTHSLNSQTETLFLNNNGHFQYEFYFEDGNNPKNSEKKFSFGSFIKTGVKTYKLKSDFIPDSISPDVKVDSINKYSLTAVTIITNVLQDKSNPIKGVFKIGNDLSIHFIGQLDTILDLKEDKLCSVEIEAPEFYVKGTPPVLHPTLKTKSFYIHRSAKNTVTVPIEFNAFYYVDFSSTIIDEGNHYLVNGRKVLKKNEFTP